MCVVLWEQIPHVWGLPYDLMLQSDARDAVTLTETSPFLLHDRLHLAENAPGVTYVNGGVFFARGTSAVARLFEDTWAMVSQVGVPARRACALWWSCQRQRRRRACDHVPRSPGHVL